MSEKRTITLAAAAADDNLWRRVECGEVLRVTARFLHRTVDVSHVYEDHGKLMVWYGEYDWQGSGDYDLGRPNRRLTIHELAPDEQQPNSPAAIERLQRQLVERDDTIDRLTCEVASLRDFLSGLGAAGDLLAAYDAMRDSQPAATARQVRQMTRGLFVGPAGRDEVGDE